MSSKKVLAFLLQYKLGPLFFSTWNDLFPFHFWNPDLQLIRGLWQKLISKRKVSHFQVDGYFSFSFSLVTATILFINNLDTECFNILTAKCRSQATRRMSFVVLVLIFIGGISVRKSMVKVHRDFLWFDLGMSSYISWEICNIYLVACCYLSCKEFNTKQPKGENSYLSI